MSESSPITQEAPQQSVGGVWWQSRTVMASIVAVLLAAPSLIEQIAPFLNAEQRAKALAFAAIAATIASLFARKGGVDAAKAAAGEVLTATVSAPANRIETSVLREVREKLKL